MMRFDVSSLKSPFSGSFLPRRFFPQAATAQASEFSKKADSFGGFQQASNNQTSSWFGFNFRRKNALPSEGLIHKTVEVSVSENGSPSVIQEYYRSSISLPLQPNRFSHAHSSSTPNRLSLPSKVIDDEEKTLYTPSRSGSYVSLSTSSLKKASTDSLKPSEDSVKQPPKRSIFQSLSAMMFKWFGFLQNRRSNPASTINLVDSVTKEKSISNSSAWDSTASLPFKPLSHSPSLSTLRPETSGDLLAWDPTTSFAPPSVQRPPIVIHQKEDTASSTGQHHRDSRDFASALRQKAAAVQNGIEGQTFWVISNPSYAHKRVTFTPPSRP